MKARVTVGGRARWPFCHRASHRRCRPGRIRASRGHEGANWNSLVLPARLSGAAAGNCAHSNIGKVCSLLLVRADYIGRAPGRGPEGTGNCSSCYGNGSDHDHDASLRAGEGRGGQQQQNILCECPLTSRPRDRSCDAKCRCPRGLALPGAGRLSLATSVQTVTVRATSMAQSLRPAGLGVPQVTGPPASESAAAGRSQVTVKMICDGSRRRRAAFASDKGLARRPRRVSTLMISDSEENSSDFSYIITAALVRAVF